MEMEIFLWDRILPHWAIGQWCLEVCNDWWWKGREGEAIGNGERGEQRLIVSLLRQERRGEQTGSWCAAMAVKRVRRTEERGRWAAIGVFKRGEASEQGSNPRGVGALENDGKRGRFRFWKVGDKRKKGKEEREKKFETAQMQLK